MGRPRRKDCRICESTEKVSRGVCQSCHSAGWANRKAEKRDEERHAIAVQINRMINALPRVA